MNQASAGGGAGASAGILGGDLLMLIDDVEATVKKMNSPISSASEAHSALGSMKASVAAFGGVEAAQAVGHMHTEVADIFKSTLAALQSGLEDCKANLDACVQTHKENDQMQAERMASLAKQLDGSAAGTRRAYQSGGGQAAQHGDSAGQGQSAGGDTAKPQMGT